MFDWLIDIGDLVIIELHPSTRLVDMRDIVTRTGRLTHVSDESEQLIRGRGGIRNDWGREKKRTKRRWGRHEKVL